ncbi:MAG: PepSY-associated TM helix domain-containing protein [Deferrisomatales bacterium]
MVDLLAADGRVLALTRDRLYRAGAEWPPRFADATPARAPEAARRIPLFRLVFHLHSGEVWGLAGRLAVDALGLVLAFLCLTGVWFWWRKRRGTLARGAGGRLARRGLGWHLKLGLWSSPLLLFVTLTGIFQRPPFLVAIAPASYPASAHPAPVDPNPWHDLLRKALHDPVRQTLVLATADGFFEGPADLSAPFAPLAGGPPVSVMGATVMRRDPGGHYWVGSMSGLYGWDRETDWVVDAFTGAPPRPSNRGPVGDHLVMGLVDDGAGGFWVADYEHGLRAGVGRAAPPPMPRELAGGGRISLWHALFELHNGRLFGFLLGWWSWVVVPLGGLAVAAVVASGVVDRWRPGARGRGPGGRGAPPPARPGSGA